MIEAGHLAIMPSRFRSLVNGNIDEAVKTMLETVDFSNPDAPEARAAIQDSDPEATAWAWAAGLAIGLPEEEVIRDVDYEGSGREVRSCLAVNCYIGIHGLAHAGFCVTRSYLVETMGLPAYPTLARWTQA